MPNKSKLALHASVVCGVIITILLVLSCIQSPEIQFWIDEDKCVGCGSCVEICPYDAIHLENNQAVIDYSKCKNCGKCVDACDYNAIK